MSQNSNIFSNTWNDLMDAARDTKLIRNAQKAFQNYGYRESKGETGHKGDWGTVERGYTEFAQDLLKPSSAYADSGGSNFIDTTGQQSVANTSGGMTVAPQMSYDPGGSTGGDTGGGGGSSGPDLSNPAKRTEYAHSQGYDSYEQMQNDQSSGGGPSAEELARQRQMQQAQEYYDQLMGSANRLENMYGQRRSDWKNRVSNLYGSQLEEAGQQKQAAMRDIEGYRGDVREDQKTTLRRLADDMRNMLQAGQMTLGAAGAGSSSAAPMYAYALSKQANQRRGDVMAQTRGMMQELRQKELDVKDQYNSQKRQLQQWKESKMGEIGDWYMNAISQIQSRRDAAAGQKAQMQNQALQSAIDRLSQLDNAAMQYDQQLDKWGRDRMAQLNNYKLEIQDSANFDPRQLTYSEMQGIQAPNPRAQFDPNSYNPYARKRDEFEEYVGNMLG